MRQRLSIIMIRWYTVQEIPRVMEVFCTPTTRKVVSGHLPHQLPVIFRIPNYLSTMTVKPICTGAHQMYIPFV